MPKSTAAVLERARRYNKTRYKEWAKLGLCRKCGKRKPRAGKVCCYKCERSQAGWYAAHKETISKYNKRYVDKLRNEVFDAYGGAYCGCCGEAHREFLTVDHAKGDGAAHRRSIGRGAHTLYLWLKRNKYPPGFRILCMNCNFSHGMLGYCPHEKGAYNA